MQTILPDSEVFVEEEYTGEDTNIRSVHKAENGYVIETVVYGYAGDITMLVGVTNEGTVTGMVKAFFDMANAGNNIDIQVLSSGIYEAMVTTVGGLIVGIIGYFLYNILVTRINKVVFLLEARAMEFMDLLNEPA